MRRMTRRIGLFGGPAAMMSAAGVKKPPVKTSRETTDGPPASETAEPATSAAPAKKGWFSRIFGSEKD